MYYAATLTSPRSFTTFLQEVVFVMIAADGGGLFFWISWSFSADLSDFSSQFSRTTGTTYYLDNKQLENTDYANLKWIDDEF